jgi:hypothetical protein
MTSAKDYKYRVNLIPIAHVTETKRLSFTITTHDNLFELLPLIQNKLRLDAASEQAFVLGLKMFSEITLKNRAHPLFKQLRLPLKEMMTILKSYYPQTE